MGIYLRKEFENINVPKSKQREKALQVLELAKKQEQERIESKKHNSKK